MIRRVSETEREKEKERVSEREGKREEREREVYVLKRDDVSRGNDTMAHCWRTHL